VLDQPARTARDRSGPLRIVYFGRTDRAKGPDLLTRALKIIPKTPVQINIYAVRQSAGPDQICSWLSAQAQQDPRLTLRAAVAPDKVIGVMAECRHSVAMAGNQTAGCARSLCRWRSVLGSNLGGIAELVRSGIDGFLVPPDDGSAWAAAIAKFEENPHLVCEMRRRITTPRSMEAVVDDMAVFLFGCYRRRCWSMGAA
jgi:glycosyltransferase involved in cell wall biosynthesis